MQPNPSYLVWLDLEMTGLNPEIERIIEMAAIITDQDLHIVAQSSEIVIHQSDELLNRMDAWNTSHHTQSGLVDQVKQSQISEKQAEEQLLEFVSHYVPKGKSPLCGNTIYQDRRFLAKYMPTLEQFFHYRNLDVSTIKILAQRWNPAITKVREVEKDSRHRALQDIRDSINELKYYREHFFKLGN